jgi:hypothetical protein
MFLKFMLARLLSARQVVLLGDDTDIHLFYKGKVYYRQTNSSIRNLPKCQQAEYFPIWMLVEVDYSTGGPPITGSSNVWPIQTSSPNPNRWKVWRQQNRAALLGMPLWKMEELMEGYVIGLSTPSVIDPSRVV